MHFHAATLTDLIRSLGNTAAAVITLWRLVNHAPPSLSHPECRVCSFHDLLRLLPCFAPCSQRACVACRLSASLSRSIAPAHIRCIFAQPVRPVTCESRLAAWSRKQKGNIGWTSFTTSLRSKGKSELLPPRFCKADVINHSQKRLSVVFWSAKLF